MQAHKKLKARILSLALSVAMVTTMMPVTALAAEGGNVAPGISSVSTIQSFDKLEDRFIPSVGENAPSHVYGLTVELNTPFEDLNLPDELTAMVARTTAVAEDEPVVDSGKPSEPAEDETIPDEDKPAESEAVPDEDAATDDTVSGNQPASPSDAVEEVKEEIKDEDIPLAPEPEQDEETIATNVEQETIPVTWNSDKEYKSDENGKFVYTAVLPEGYILADGVKLPQIYVLVGRQARAAETTVSNFDAFKTAVANANDGDVIKIDTSFSMTASLTIRKSVTIQGVGDGITLTRGTFSINYGMFTINSSVTFENLTIDGNNVTAASRGAGLYISSDGNTLILKNVVVQNCITSTTAGGGIYVDSDSTLSMTGGAIKNNTNTHATGMGGGVFMNTASIMTINGGSITGNSCADGRKGGGILVNGKLSIAGNVNISGNKAGTANNNTYISSPSGTWASPIVVTGALDAGSTIGVSSTGQVAKGNGYTLVEDDVAKFVSDDPNLSYFLSGSGASAIIMAPTAISKSITIGTVAPVKAATIVNGTATPPTGANAPVITWSADGGSTFVTASGSFVEGIAYQTKYVYTAKTGYVFNSSIIATDITVTNIGAGSKTVALSDSNQTLTITVTWPATAEATPLTTITVGGTEATPGYETANETNLEKAIAAIAAGGTIKLGADIDTRGGGVHIENKVCTLDLNGKTLTNSESGSGLSLVRLVGTTSLTVTDSSVAKNGAITSSADSETIMHQGTGNLTILAGTVSGTDSHPAIRCSNGTITIEGGTVSSNSMTSPTIISSGKITMSGGTVTGVSALAANGTIKITAVPTPAAIVLDIQGGTVSNTGTFEFQGAAYNSVIFPSTVTAENRSSYYSHTGGTVGTVVPSALADYTGTQAAAPSSTPSAKTATSITLAAVTVSGETIEYAKSTSSTAPTTGWQDSTAFTGLTADTQYYFFARVKANSTHKAGTASAGTAIKTDKTDAQKVAAAKLLADAAVTNLTATNATTAAGILSTVNTAITSVTGVTATWKSGSPTITPATDSAAGSITGTIVLTCGSATVEVTVNKPIAQLGSDAEKVANAKAAAVAALNSYTATNATADSDIMALVNKAITDAGITGITAAWKSGSGFDKTNATASATGSVTGTIILKLNSAEQDVVVNLTIAQLADKAALTAKINEANNAKSGITVSDNAASSVTSGVKFVTTAEMKALTDAIAAAQAIANNPASTADQVSAAITTLNNAVATFNAAIKTGTYSGGGGGGGGGGGSTPTPPETKPTEPVTGSSNTNATVDTKGNATVNVTDKNISDAVKAAKDAANKKGVNAGEVTAVINVTSPANSNPNTVTVNLPKTVQQQVINNKIDNVAIVIDKPDISIGMNLATITEMNKQANADIQLSATRTDATKLSTEAKNAIGNRPAFDLKATYNSGAKSITSFGTGSVSVAIPYTLQSGEVAGGLYAVYIDGNGKANYITGSSYDANAKMLRFATNHFSVYGIGYKAPSAFTDIAGHWAKTDIEFVANRGLMSGTSNTTFAPNGSMTRGMFVTALGRLAGVDVNSYKTGKFTDVKADAYYAPYVNWAASKGITNGTTATTFSPDSTVTRQEMAVFMSNYAKAMGYKVPETREAVTFADNGSIGSWAAAAVKQMQMAGVLNGKNGNKFDPTGTATRAEVAAVLHRYVELVIDRSTAQGLDTNDSGSAMMYENGKAVKSASRTVGSSTYNFNANGEAALLPADSKKTGTYTVQKGDSFWRIAKKVGCTMADLEQLNGKSRNDFIYAGQTLKVPQK